MDSAELELGLDWTVPLFHWWRTELVPFPFSFLEIKGPLEPDLPPVHLALVTDQRVIVSTEVRDLSAGANLRLSGGGLRWGEEHGLLPLVKGGIFLKCPHRAVGLEAEVVDSTEAGDSNADTGKVEPVVTEDDCIWPETEGVAEISLHPERGMVTVDVDGVEGQATVVVILHALDGSALEDCDSISVWPEVSEELILELGGTSVTLKFPSVEVLGISPGIDTPELHRRIKIEEHLG